MFSPELEQQEDGTGREGRDYWEGMRPASPMVRGEIFFEGKIAKT